MTELRTAIAAILACLAACGQPAPSAGPAKASAVRTAILHPERVVVTVRLPGRTAAFRQAEIRPQVSGLLRERLFTEGDTVAAGQPLYRIDPEPFQAALDAAEAALRRAQASRVATRTRAERTATLLADGLVSQQDHDDAASALAAADAEIASLEAQARAARISLGHATITAPIPGRIGRSAASEGAVVTAFQAQAMATIQQLDPIYVDVPQSTADLLRIRKAVESGVLGADRGTVSGARLILEDGSVLPEAGELRFREAAVEAGTGTVTARLVFPNPRGDLLPDMFVRAELAEGSRERALLVPQQGVQRDAKGRPYVFLVQDGQASRRTISVERAIGDRWLVAGGLEDGAEVVIEGLQSLLMAPPGSALPVTASATAAQAR